MSEALTIPEFQVVKIPFPSPQFEISGVWLDEYSGGNSRTSLKFLQWLRSGVKHAQPGQLEAYQKAYDSDLGKHQSRLQAALKPVTWDLLVEAPSSKPHAAQFAEVARVVRETPEIILKKTTATSATGGSSVDQLTNSLILDSELDLSVFRNVLIVDDVLAVGNTVTAIIHKLQLSGLNTGAKISLAVALRVIPSPPRIKIDLAKI